MNNDKTTDDEKEGRKSLIDKYKKEVNNTDISFNSRNSTLDRDLNKRKKKIYIGIGILAILALIILIIVLCVSSSNIDDPAPTPTPPIIVTPTENPYYVNSTDNSKFGVKSMTISRDKSANSFNSSYVKETTSNKFIDEAAIQASLKSYSSVRL